MGEPEHQQGCGVGCWQGWGVVITEGWSGTEGGGSRRGLQDAGLL